MRIARWSRLFGVFKPARVDLDTATAIGHAVVGRLCEAAVVSPVPAAPRRSVGLQHPSGMSDADGGSAEGVLPKSGEMR
jgi:hypothetical protein